jgi:hypothetical protein
MDDHFMELPNVQTEREDITENNYITDNSNVPDKTEVNVRVGESGEASEN